MDVPSSRSKRILILHCGSTIEFVEGCLLLSAKYIKDNCLNYHQDMNSALFEEWSENTLLSKFTSDSVIVMDNVSFLSQQEKNTK